MWKAISTFISGHRIAFIAGLLLVLASASTFAVMSFNSHIADVKLEARTVAIAECNATQFEEDLRVAQANNILLLARIKEIENERNLSERERADLRRFITSLDPLLADAPDGEISERTRLFMTLLSQRSEQYHEND